MRLLRFALRLRLLALALLLAACGEPPPYHQEAFVFGTRVEVTIHGANPDRSRAAAGAVLREFDRLHRMLHAWQDSEVTRLNAAIARGERDVAVSPELAALIVAAQDLAQKSESLFDPGIGGLVELWGFHADEYRPALPDAGRLAAWLAARPGILDLKVEGTRVTSAKREVALDFGGHAKGYALDRATAILREAGIANALVNIGGNVLALGSKGGAPWRVGIRHPRQSGVLAILDLHDGEAIGTSGDYQRFFEVDGHRYSHLLDPRSGRPAEGAQAATVLVTPRPGAGTLSDAASKPLFVDPVRWREHARRLGLNHALVVRADGGIDLTRAFAERLRFEGRPELRLVD